MWGGGGLESKKIQKHESIYLKLVKTLSIFNSDPLGRLPLMSPNTFCEVLKEIKLVNEAWKNSKSEGYMMNSIKST